MSDITRETEIVKAILKYLKNDLHVFAYKTHGSPYQLIGLPDIIGCHNGRFFAIEVKSAVGRPTQHQLIVLEQIRNAGGVAGICRSVIEAEQLMAPLVNRPALDQPASTAP